MSLRTEKNERLYQKSKENGQLVGLENEPAIRVWTHWKLIINAYPHDKIATDHHLLVAKGASDVLELSIAELDELFTIIRQLKYVYDAVKINLPSMTSVKYVAHVHLYRYKQENK